MEATPQRWSVAQIHALAPDAASQKAGSKLAAPAPWSGTGARAESHLLWGDCKGSGAKPYQVTISLPAVPGAAPAYACTCPSHKFPCKHSLGLLLLWSNGGVPETQTVPARVDEWVAGRRERAEKTEARKVSAAEKAAELADDPKAAEKAAKAAARRANQRSDRVTAGLDELDRWLGDQMRAGLAGTGKAGYRPLDDLARRLVDAQAPGVATRVKALSSALHGEDWPSRALAEFARLHLLVQGWRHRDQLPAPLGGTVRRRVGINQTAAEIAETGEHVTDHWTVLGVSDRLADKLLERRVWLQGRADGRVALLLAFAPPGQAPGLALPVGAGIEAELAFAVEALPQRAVVVEQKSLTPLGGPPRGTTLDEAAAHFAAALAADPWTTSIPVVLESATLGTESGGARRESADGSEAEAAGPWRVVDAKAGLATALDDSDAAFESGGPGRGESARAEPVEHRILAAGGGRPGPLFGLYRPEGLNPITLWSDGIAVDLT